MNDLAPQKCHQIMPESRGELPASISGNGFRCSIATHKMHTNASTIDCAVMSGRGIASGQREKRSTMVIMHGILLKEMMDQLYQHEHEQT